MWIIIFFLWGGLEAGWRGDLYESKLFCLLIIPILDKQHELDFPEGEEEEEEPQKAREVAKKSSIAPRGSNIMAKIVAQRDVSITSAFKDEEIPAAGVLTDHEAELSKVKKDLLYYPLLHLLV